MKKQKVNSISIHPLAAVRYVMVLVLLVCAVLTQMGSRLSDTPIETVLDNVKASCDFSSMKPADNRMIKRLYKLNANDYDGIVLYAPVSNMDAQELLIVKLKDVSQSEAVEAAIKTRLQTQKDSFEGYGVEQFKLLEDHVLEIKGNYIFYFVHPDASKGEEAFLKSL